MRNVVMILGLATCLSLAGAPVAECRNCLKGFICYTDSACGGPSCICIQKRLGAKGFCA